MSKYLSYRYQIIITSILLHVTTMFVVSVLRFFGGFDDQEYCELIGCFSLITFLYALTIYFFSETLGWFLPNGFKANKTQLLYVFVFLLLAISLKALGNFINYQTMMFSVKVIEIVIILICCRKKKMPSGL